MAGWELAPGRPSVLDGRPAAGRSPRLERPSPRRQEWEHRERPGEQLLAEARAACCPWSQRDPLNSAHTPCIARAALGHHGGGSTERQQQQAWAAVKGIGYVCYNSGHTIAEVRGPELQGGPGHQSCKDPARFSCSAARGTHRGWGWGSQQSQHLGSAQPLEQGHSCCSSRTGAQQ